MIDLILSQALSCDIKRAGACESAEWVPLRKLVNFLPHSTSRFGGGGGGGLFCQRGSLLSRLQVGVAQLEHANKCCVSVSVLESRAGHQSLWALFGPSLWGILTVLYCTLLAYKRGLLLKWRQPLASRGYAPLARERLFSRARLHLVVQYGPIRSEDLVSLSHRPLLFAVLSEISWSPLIAQ